VAVAVLALVSTGIVAEVCCRPVTGDSAFSDAGHSGGVVLPIRDSGVGDVMVMADDGYLGEQARLFEVAVSELSRRVRLQDESGLDVIREQKPPDVPLPQSVEVDASHADFGVVRGSQERWCLGDNFRQVCRTAA
jgi:hypothetical protein